MSYTYGAFGVEKNISDSDTNAFRYCGEYFDSETGTIYLRARYYNPTTGRFISRDSYAGKNEDPLSLNRYTYCQNNPIFYFDPTGHNAWTNFWDEFADCWMVGSSGCRESWNIGNKEIASYGKAGELAANFNQVVVDTSCGYGVSAKEFVQHPVKTTGNAVAQFVADPMKPIRDMSINMTLAVYTHDWDSVAYQVGGLTTHTAAIGSTYMVASSIPSSINLTKPKLSACALSNGKTAVCLTYSTARVSTAGAVSIGESVAGVNIMYSKGGKQNYRSSEFVGVSDDDLNKKYKEAETSAERQKIKTEQKARKLRHSSQKK